MNRILDLSRIRGSVFSIDDEEIVYDTVKSFIEDVAKRETGIAIDYEGEDMIYIEDPIYLKYRHILDYQIISENQLSDLISEYNYMIVDFNHVVGKTQNDYTELYINRRTVIKDIERLIDYFSQLMEEKFGLDFFTYEIKADEDELESLDNPELLGKFDEWKNRVNKLDSIDR